MVPPIDVRRRLTASNLNLCDHKAAHIFECDPDGRDWPYAGPYQLVNLLFQFVPLLEIEPEDQSRARHHRSQ